MSLWGWATNFGALPAMYRQSGDAASPTTLSPQVQAWMPELVLCRTLYNGWEALREACTVFLPQHPGESNEDYKIRLSRPTFYNAFGRTVRALAGTVFKEAPTPVGVPQDIQALYTDDVDLEGTEGNAFLLHAFTDSLITGLAGIFVDMPANTGGITKLEAQQLDIRPFWQLIRKDDIVSFRVDVVNGKTVLGQLVVKECIERPMGAFGVGLYDRYRVFRRTQDAVTFEAWEGDAKSGKIVQVTGSAGEFRGVTEIPFAPIYTAREDFMHAPPPLLDLAHLNLLHYQVNSDIHHAAHIANVPFLFGGGFPAVDLQVGPNRAVVIESAEEGKAFLRWLETTGASIGSTRALLADIEEQMAHLGLGMLQRKSRAAETAEKVSIDRQEQDSTLAAIVSDLENGVELALYYTAQFLGDADGKGGRLEFSRDFQMDPPAAARTENQGAPLAPREPMGPGITNNPRTSER